LFSNKSETPLMGTSFTGIESGYPPDATRQVNSAQASIFSRVTAVGSLFTQAMECRNCISPKCDLSRRGAEDFALKSAPSPALVSPSLNTFAQQRGKVTNRIVAPGSQPLNRPCPFSKRNGGSSFHLTPARK
jgi:hypothetical protein